MLRGNPPYPQIFDNGVLQYRLPSHTSENMRNLVAKLLSRDPDARPSASQAIQHEVFRYKGQQYTGKKLSCSFDDLDGIIKMALDNKLCIYAVVPKSEYVHGEYNNTGIYYIPDLGRIIVVNDQRLSKLLFPVKFISDRRTIIVATSAITKFITTAKRGDYLSELLWSVHIIVSHSISELPGHDYSVANRDCKVKIDRLYFHIKDVFDPSTLSGIVKYMTANVCVTSILSLSSSPSQPIVNLCEAIRDMDGRLEWLYLTSIDLSGEQRLADTLKGMEELKRLTLNNTGISADALVQIGHKLKHKLEWLHVHNEPCFQSPDTCGRFFNAIKQNSIRFLWLTKNKLNASHLSALPDILPTMKDLCRLYLDDFEGMTLKHDPARKGSKICMQTDMQQFLNAVRRSAPKV